MRARTTQRNSSAPMRPRGTRDSPRSSARSSRPSSPSRRRCRASRTAWRRALRRRAAWWPSGRKTAGGDCIVGIAIWGRAGRTCELAALYVVPGAWGSGAARMLLDAVLTAMRVRGAEDAFLWVGEANARARRFYEREGWAADGGARAGPGGPRELRAALESE